MGHPHLTKALDFLSGGGEMGRLMREHDWEASCLGAPVGWPQSLKTVVRMMLSSRFAMWMAWGNALTFFCNDAYRPTLGVKQSWALGASSRDVWAEIWPEIGPRIDSVLSAGAATYDENLLLFLERSGFKEETYHTFSYSPLADDEGNIAGMLCVVTEDTERVIGERRLKLLRDLASALSLARTEEETFEAFRAQARELADLPFTLTYLFDPDGSGAASLACATGSLEASRRAPSGWPANLLSPQPSPAHARLGELATLERPHSPSNGGSPAAPIELAFPLPEGEGQGEGLRPWPIPETQHSWDAMPPDDRWPVREALESGRPVLIEDIAACFHSPLPPRPYDTAPREAVLTLLAKQGQKRPAGFMIAALNPFRRLEPAYAGFVDLLAGLIAASLDNARAYEDERRRAEALAEIDRAKTAFFSNVSHEFRTPLTLMLGPLEDLLGDAGVAGAPARDRLRIVHRNALRLLKLVNSLLDFSRIEAGRASANFEPVDLAALTKDLASNFRSACARAGLRLVLDCPSLPREAFVDRDMWEKIVLNLLSNAFKFTFVGEIRVALEAGRDEIVLTVSDTGVGIPKAEIPRLFERFHRIEGSHGRSHEGSGIGLALVLELVKTHGGHIDAQSEEGKGSAFRISIPYGGAPLGAPRRETAATPRTVRADAYVEEALSWLPGSSNLGTGEFAANGGLPETHVSESGSRARVLLADDNADMRAYVSRLLSARHDVEAVADGQAALDAALRQRPDLVLTDIMMPGLDGFGLIEAIRESEAFRDVPIIVLSARAGEEASIEGLAAGADDYLIKPFSARELIARVDAALKLARLRRETSEVIRETSGRLKAALAASGTGTFRWNFADNSISWDDAFLSLFGLKPGEGMTYEKFLSMVHPEDREAVRAHLAHCVSDGADCDIEYRIVLNDGCERWILDKGLTFKDAGGRPLYMTGACVDISERKEAELALRRLNDSLEERVAQRTAELDAAHRQLIAETLQREEVTAQLRQAQKMEAIGKLTGGVAHDFNNLLQVISGNLQLLSKEVGANERAEKRIRNALTGVSRGSKLASQLLAFGRRQPLEPKVVNLGRYLRGLDEMLRRALGEEIELETIAGGGLWNACVDITQLENAILNLAINARDAMKGRGRLTIEAGNAWLDDVYAARHPDVSAGQYVMIAVSDTGPGIDPDIIDRVFEPFFTTKPEGEGTGLGLSMVYGFVKQSGGHAKIYSEVGQGTTVRLYLPRTRQEEDIVIPTEAGPIAGGAETILVVEDDEGVRQTVVDILADLGYRVLKAKDAQAALVVIESGVPIDLLFTDVVMPGPLRSTELAKKAHERLPDIAILFTSGYTDNAIVHGGRLDEGTHLLSKPYTREALARKIRQVLGDNARRDGVTKKDAHPRRKPVDANGGALFRILVVEDEPFIRAATADFLKDLGHTVFEAKDAPSALKVFDAESVDLLLTDVGLPGQTGIELALQCRDRCPGIKVVLATGYSRLLDDTSDARLSDAVVLTKPFTIEALAKALRTLALS
jgi:PAS domain S-box-containing protein